jgi:hypothetical protein
MAEAGAEIDWAARGAGSGSACWTAITAVPASAIAPAAVTAAVRAVIPVSLPVID